MRSASLSFLLAFVLFIPAATVAQVVDTAEKIRQVERSLAGKFQSESDTLWTLKDRMTHYHINGVSIAVIHNYKLEWAKGYGLANAAANIPVTPQTLFQAGSISKSLNAVGILLLAQQKRLDLYTDINTYLHSWKFPYDSLSKGKKITIANLLSHTGGLSVHGFNGYQRGADIPTIVQVLDGQKPANSTAIRSTAEPGVKYNYSGGGIIISQLIITDVSGKAYDQFIYDNVLKPLDMTASTYQQPPVEKDSTLISAGYYADGGQVPGKYHIYPEQAAAGLWTNPTDLSKYIIETQLAYEGKSQKVLNQDFTKLRLTPYIDKNVGLGVFIDDFNGTKYFQHGGADEGYISQFYGSYEGGNGVVVMVNATNGTKIIPEIINSVAKVYGFKGLGKAKFFKNIALPDSVLQNYTGRYRIATNLFVSVFKEGPNLYSQATGQERTQLYPETDRRFFLKAADAEIEFIKDDKGAVVKMMLYQNGTHEAKKMDMPLLKTN